MAHLLKADQYSLFRYHFGMLIGFLIIASWVGLLCFNLFYQVSLSDPLILLLILLQTHLYTGLFITAHDAMHGTVSPNKKWNHLIGWIAAGLFAFNFYPKLCKNHYKHHGQVAEESDPDYHDGPFWIWYFHFMKNYLGIIQIVLMAGTYNILNLYFHEANIMLFWVIPGILSTLQLFYFGTYLPHKEPSSKPNKHKSSTQAKNHVWAFLTCYFFGYHYEHHQYPGLPWWLLHKAK